MYIEIINITPTFARSAMLEADRVAAALGAYQVASGRIRLIVGAADWPSFRLVTLAPFCGAFRDLLLGQTWNGQYL